jgi:hypothetical protein
MKFMYCILITTLFLVSCGETPEIQRTQLLPEISAFLEQNNWTKDWGRVATIQEMPDWANGKRQRVNFSAGDSGRSLLFYTKEGKVITIYEDQLEVGRVMVWGKGETYDAPEPVARAADENFPSYTILFSVKKIDGSGKYGDILVPSFSLKTPIAQREAFVRQIAKKEGFAELSLYSTKDAYQANMSASFLKTHPNALREGFLGMLQNGKFVAGEKLKP